MPRKPLIRNKTLPYHITARANNRDWFYLSTDTVWSIVNEQCLKISEEYSARIHALVLMSNHLHLLVTTPEGNLGEIMNYFLREISREINRLAGRINHVFGGPYKWSLIGGSLYYQHALKYLYRNPVKARLCSVVEEYDFSTLRVQLLGSGCSFPLYASVFNDRGILALPPVAQLSWLNLAYNEKEEECIRRALRHREFTIIPDPITRQIPAIFEEPL